MLPYIHLINRDVPVYGLLMAVGGVLGWLLSLHRAQRHAPELPRESVTRFYLIFLAGALIGAKVYALILVWSSLKRNFSLLWTNPQLFLQMYLYGGMVFYGGLISGALCVAGLLLSRSVRFSQLETVYLLCVPLVHGIGRIGCFCAGCCYGVPTDSILGVVYPAGGAAPSGIPLMPVQLFESAGDFVLCAVLCLPFYRQPGRRLAVYLSAGVRLPAFCHGMFPRRCGARAGRTSVGGPVDQHCMYNCRGNHHPGTWLPGTAATA